MTERREGQIRNPEHLQDREVMAIPQISVEREKGIDLLTLALRSVDETDSELDAQTVDTITRLSQEVDEEALYMLATTLERDDRTPAVLDLIRRYKNVQDPQGTVDTLHAVLATVETEASEAVLMVEQFQRRLRTVRSEQLSGIAERLGVHIDFFRPRPSDTPVKRVTIALDTPFTDPQEGSGIAAGEELIIRSHVDNEDNVDHEFLHSVINPIVESLDAVLDVEAKERITRAASRKLSQSYDGWSNILAEELIRTYVDVYSKGGEPQTRVQFEERMATLTQESYERALGTDKDANAILTEMGITTLEALKLRAGEFFDAAISNPLRDGVFRHLSEYETREDETQSFAAFTRDRALEWVRTMPDV